MLIMMGKRNSSMSAANAVTSSPNSDAFAARASLDGRLRNSRILSHTTSGMAWRHGKGFRRFNRIDIFPSIICYLYTWGPNGEATELDLSEELCSNRCKYSQFG